MVRKGFDKPAVEVSESNEGLNLLFVRWDWPFCYAGNLDRIHLDLVVQDDYAEILDVGPFEFALFVAEVKVVLVHSL